MRKLIVSGALGRLGPGLRSRCAILIYAALAAAALGAMSHRNGWVIFTALLVLLSGGMVWPWVSVRQVRVAISFSPARVLERETTLAIVEVANRFPWPVLGLRLGRALADAEELTPAFAVVEGRKIRRQRLAMSFRTRGLQPVGSIWIQSGFPFGICEARRAVEAGPLVVWPRLVPVDLPLAMSRRRAPGGASFPRPGELGDVLGSREYRRGDAMRQMHWAQSARHDRLIVRELESPGSSRELIVLDADSSSYAARSDRERAIRIASGLYELWMDEGRRFSMAVGGEVIDSHRQRGVVRDALALIPELYSASLANAKRAVARHGATGGVVITSMSRVKLWQDRMGLGGIGTTDTGSSWPPTRNGGVRPTMSDRKQSPSAGERRDPLMTISSLALTAVAVAGAESALASGRSPLTVLAMGGGLAVAAWMLRAHPGCFASRAVIDASGAASARRRLLNGMLAGVFLLPVGQWLFASGTGEGAQPLEMLLLACSRNLSLGLLAARPARYYERLGAALATFVLLFSASMAEGWMFMMLIGTSSVAGCVWLLGSYCERNGLPGRRWIMPGALIPSLLILGVALLTDWALRPGDATLTTMQGFMPSSGGTGQFSPNALNGVGMGKISWRRRKIPNRRGSTRVSCSSTRARRRCTTRSSRTSESRCRRENFSGFRFFARRR